MDETSTVADFTAEERAEADRLRALPLGAQGVQGTTAALASWDWRSALSGRGPQQGFWNEGGGAYAAALAGRPAQALSPADRAEAARAAVAAARRSSEIGARSQALAGENIAAAAASGATPEIQTAMLEGARARAALLAGMAAAARADADAIARDASVLGVYGGPARREMNDAAASIAPIAAELEGRAALVEQMLRR